MNAHDSKDPFFLYLAFTAPHTPFQAPKEYLERYPSIADPNRKAYAAMVSVIDDEVGKLVAALEKKGIRNNTLIVFSSDNGGVRSSLFSGDTKVTGDLPASNGPYRDGKGTLYEGGTRVVTLANWPGRINAGVVDEPIHVTDWFPTFASLAGASTEKSKPLDGMNVWSTVSTGAPSPRKEVLYNVDPLGGALSVGNWKLVWKASLPQKVEVFDLKRDPSESTEPRKRAARCRLGIPGSANGICFANGASVADHGGRQVDLLRPTRHSRSGGRSLRRRLTAIKT